MDSFASITSILYPGHFQRLRDLHSHIGTETWLDDFTVCSPQTDWNAVPGLYIFAKRTILGWKALYVGQAESLADRLPNHERWLEAVRLGATHIHARREHRAMTRSLIERSLIQELRPQMNVQLKPIFSSPYARILQNQK